MHNPVSNGMEVTTSSERLKEYRKMVVQMLLAERTHICSVCVADDHCELQAMANQLGVDHVMFERNWSHDEIDSTHDFPCLSTETGAFCARGVYAYVTKLKASILLTLNSGAKTHR